MPEHYKIGYLYSDTNQDKYDDLYIDALNKKLEVVPLFIEEQFDFNKMFEAVRDVKVILNYAFIPKESYLTELELAKTFEKMKIRVVNSTKSIIYNEDKWMFYLKCVQCKLPTPETFIIVDEKFNKDPIQALLVEGPLILKSVMSGMGKCVEKAENYEEFEKKYKHLREINPSSPIIAQKYIFADKRSYRVTLMGNKVVQALVKIGKNWKQTGNDKSEIDRTFEPTPDLVELCERASKELQMDLCGLDLIKNDDKWYLIEANSMPGLTIIGSDTPRVLDCLSDYAYDLCKQEYSK